MVIALSDKTAEYWIFVRSNPECDPDLNVGWSMKWVRPELQATLLFI